MKQLPALCIGLINHRAQLTAEALSVGLCGLFVCENSFEDVLLGLLLDEATFDA